MGDIAYPLLSDFWPHGRVAQLYGVLRDEGTSERAIYIIDKNCIIRYVDVHDIDKQPDNEVLFRELARVENVPVPPPVVEEPTSPSSASAAALRADTGADVIMYCTNWCPACRRARAYFKHHGVNFTEINITQDREAAMRIREWTGGSETTPIFDVDGKIIINFRRAELSELLGIEE